MSSLNVCTRLAGKIRRVPHAIRWRLRDRLHPKSRHWSYLQKHHPATPILTELARDLDLKVRVYPHDVIGKQIYVDGAFEPVEWNFVKGFLKPGMTVLDLGANLGQYTLLAAKCVGAGGSVHSFEPSRRMFEELTFNVSLNGLSEICTLNNVAVTDSPGTATLSTYKPGYEVYGSLGKPCREEAQVVGRQDVPTIRLDDYLAEHGIQRVDCMKIDIEGAELFALRGAETLLSQAEAPVILIELADVNTEGFGYKALEVWDLLTSFRYRMHGLTEKGLVGECMERPPSFPRTCNVVATRDGVQS